MPRLGLLGSDPQILGVVRAALRRGDRLAVAADLPADVAAAVSAERLADWQALLDADACDVVLVGGDGWGDARRAAVRTLVQAGRPLVLSHPLELSMLWAYELDMIRRDTGGVLVPCLPDRLHPLVARLRSAIEETLGVAGRVESLLLERRMRDRSKQAVLAQLARDVDLVRAIVGDPSRLSTLPADDPDAAWPTLAVGFTGPAQVPARWQVAPGGEPGLTIRLQSETAGALVEAFDGAGIPWTWNGSPVAAFDPGSAVLGLVDAALGGGPSGDDGVTPASWGDAARAIELAETVPRSLARGRAVDLHREEFTDLGTFRGTMASLGCGLIVMALLLVIAATLVAGIAREFGWGWAGWLADSWPAVVLGVLGVFLLLQFIPLLLGGGRGTDPPRP